MDTNRIRSFLVLSETGNLREAAKLLGITHAGLSKSLRTLEDELNTELLTRDGRGIRLTREAHKLIPAMRSLLESEERLLRPTTEPPRSQIRIGTFEVFSTHLVPKLIEVFEDTSQFLIEEYLPGNLEEALKSEKCDYGITYVPVPKAGLDHMKIASVSMGIFGRDHYRQTPFESLPFVVPISTIEGAPTRVRGLDGWPDHRIERNVRFRVTLLETALSLAREGLAVGYFPRFLVAIHNRTTQPTFRLKELKNPIRKSNSQGVYAVKRKEQKEDRNFKKICRVLRTLS